MFESRRPCSEHHDGFYRVVSLNPPPRMLSGGLFAVREPGGANGHDCGYVQENTERQSQTLEQLRLTDLLSYAGYHSAETTPASKSSSSFFFSYIIMIIIVLL